MPELNRRDFLKKAAIGAAVVTGAGVITGCQGSTHASASTATNNFDHEADVVVVGMGLGGLTASLRAAELDAKVITIDKDPTGDWVGGNFPLSGQSIHVALTNPHYPIDELKRKFDEATSGTISPEMRDVYCERAHEAIKWFEALMTFSFPYAAATNGIVVDEFGNRFCDESGDRHVIAHELVKKVSMNTRGVVLFDSKIYENNVIKPLIDEMIGLGGYVVAADTLGEIAEKTGISKRLIDTVAEFNRAVDQNATDRLPVPKTNLINKIDTAPYYAIPILPGTPYTQGGPRVNTKGEVLDTDGKPIKGLYATGDLMSGNLTGLYVNRFGGYTGGLCTALTFGLITAENAVKL